MVSLPITSQLLPITQKRLIYLASTAAITRMGVAALRVWENRPSNNSNPELTPNQKRQGMLERFFVEVPGTILFTLLPLHLGQDLTAKMFEHYSSDLKIPQFGKGHEDLGFTPHEIETLNTALKEVFGRYNPKTQRHEATTKELIFRRLFGQEKPTGKMGQMETVEAKLVSLKEKLPPELYKKAAVHLNGFMMALNRSTCWSILGGVLLSALFGGMITQRLNDNKVAPMARKWLDTRYPEGHAASSTKKSPVVAHGENNPPPPDSPHSGLKKSGGLPQNGLSAFVYNHDTPPPPAYPYAQSRIFAMPASVWNTGAGGYMIYTAQMPKGGQ